MIRWDSSQTMAESSGLMEAAGVDPLQSTAVKFVAFLEGLAPGLTLSVSYAVTCNWTMQFLPFYFVSYLSITIIKMTLIKCISAAN